MPPQMTQNQFQPRVSINLSQTINKVREEQSCTHSVHAC